MLDGEPEKDFCNLKEHGKSRAGPKRNSLRCNGEKKRAALETRPYSRGWPHSNPLLQNSIP
jgi:hypothetical protein